MFSAIAAVSQILAIWFLILTIRECRAATLAERQPLLPGPSQQIRFRDPNRPRFDPNRPVPPFLNHHVSDSPVAFIDVEFTPFLLANGDRNATSIVVAFLDVPPVTFNLCNENGVNFLNEDLVDFFASNTTLFGWNPSNDVKTLISLGYNAPVILHMDKMLPFTSKCGISGPALSVACRNFDTPFFGKHAIGEVISMAMLYKKQKPTCKEPDHLSSIEYHYSDV